MRESYISSDNKNELKKFYSVDEEIKFIGLKHELPFGKIKFPILVPNV